MGLGPLMVMQVTPRLCFSATVIQNALSATDVLVRMREELMATFRVWHDAMVQLRLRRLVVHLVGIMIEVFYACFVWWRARVLLLWILAIAYSLLPWI